MESSEYLSDFEEDDHDANSEGEEFDGRNTDSNFDTYDLKSESSENLRPLNNKTFSHFEIREIENNNAVLRKKVLAHKNRPKQFKTANFQPKVTSSEINRRKQQRQIDHDNMLILKKIQSIKPFGLSKITSKG